VPRIEDLKNYQLVGLLDALVREAKPAAVLTHGPTDFHHDHVTVYHATVAAQRITQFDLFSYVPTMTRPCRCLSRRTPTSTSRAPWREAAGDRRAQEPVLFRGLAFEFYRDLARVNGRMVGVDYAEALAVDKIVFRLVVKKAV
jgi:LmbE family N-acetylglucosaminyl deacetylase